MSIDQPNPYDSPTVPISKNIDVNPVLATRLARLCAALIDYVLLGVCFVCVTICGLYFGLLSQVAEQSFTLFLLMLSIYLAINGYLLAANGQTVGKMLLGLRIVDIKTGRKLPFYRVFLLRSLWAFLLLLVPPTPLANFLVIADAAMIFLLQQRCLHDWIAGSTVVDIHSSQSN